MGMRFTHEGPDRFATVVGGRPGGKGGRAVSLSPALSAFLTRLLDEPETRRRFLADPAAAVAADAGLTEGERGLLLAIPPEKLRALETMIPAAAAQKRAPVVAAAVTALGVFLGLALPVIAENGPHTMPPGGIRPDIESDERITPETGIRPDVTPAMEQPRLKITKGIRPDFEDDLQVSRGIRPDFEDFEEDGVVLGPPALPQGTTEVDTGTTEIDTGKSGEAKLDQPVKPPKPGVAPVHIDRPNVTRGIRPTF